MQTYRQDPQRLAVVIQHKPSRSPADILFFTANAVTNMRYFHMDMPGIGVELLLHLKRTPFCRLFLYPGTFVW